jgi:ATP-binding cassette, subfamily B, bacterial
MFADERRMIPVTKYRARHYWLGTFGWILWFVSPLGPGWLTAELLRVLETKGAHGEFWTLFVGLFCAHLGNALLLLWAHRIYVQGVESSKALLKANVLAGQTASGGPEAAARTVPVGDVLTRLRDDPFDILFLIDNWADFVGTGLFALGGVILMARIDAWATLAGLVPMLGLGIANRLVGNLARRYRERSRTAASNVGDFLTAAFQASLTVKVGGARHDVMRRFRELSSRRSELAVVDETWNTLVWNLNNAGANICVGAALVVAARGRMSASEVTLFATYLANMVWLPQRIGGIIVGRRRSRVSLGRLDALVAPRSHGVDGVDHLMKHRALPVLHGPPALVPTLGERTPLRTLTVSNLTLEERGLVDVSFEVVRGSLTVISGPVGSGKTSLLRAIVGALPIDSGSVSWNGELVSDRAAFFIPPQCAYVSQVPKLFAESLHDNLALAYQFTDAQVHEAISLAAFDSDVAELAEGLKTPIGARGVRLSGGQAQRAAATRALVHRPELLVLDDLTSALDVETEHQLWERLAAAGFTVLAASNRPVALARADQVIALG